MGWKSKHFLAKIPRSEKKSYKGYKYHVTEDHAIDVRLKLKKGDTINNHELLVISDKSKLEDYGSETFRATKKQRLRITLLVEKNILFNGANYSPDWYGVKSWKAHDMLYSMHITNKKASDSVLSFFRRKALAIDDKTFGISRRAWKNANPLEYYNS